MLLSSDAQAADQTPRFLVPNDFRGPVYLIGNSKIPKKLQGEIEIGKTGIIFCSTLKPVKHKTLSDIIFRFKDGRRLAPGDADTTDENIHVWNVALGSGVIDGRYLEYIVVFIGTSKEERDLLNVQIDLSVISKMLKLTEADGMTGKKK